VITCSSDLEDGRWHSPGVCRKIALGNGVFCCPTFLNRYPDPTNYFECELVHA
jgi:hypothetical protein